MMAFYQKKKLPAIVTSLYLLLTISTSIRAQPTNKIAYDDGLDIFVMNVDGSEIQQRTSGSNSSQARISPDGTEIVFVSDRDGNDEIYIMDIYGNNLRKLTNNNHPDFSPSWSPDGTKIAYVSGTASNFDIHIMNTSGGDTLNITQSSANEIDAIWSPVDNRIAFISNQNGPYQIYTVLSDGSAYQRLTNTNFDLVTRFVWSPDGTRIAFYNGQDGELYSISSDGTGYAAVTSDEGDIGTFFWISSNLIIFHDPVSGWILMNSDGSGRSVVNLDWPVPTGNFSFPTGLVIPTPPSNLPPVVDAGEDQFVVATDGVSAEVTLYGNSSDTDGELNRLDWYRDGILLGGGISPHALNIELEAGTHILILAATDNRGLTHTDEVVITVQAPHRQHWGRSQPDGCRWHQPQ